MLKSADELIREAQAEIECVDVATARKLFDECPGAVIVDVRDADQLAKSKLGESVNISRGMLEYGITKACPEATTLIFTHCAGGGRASLAAHTLKRMGYSRVYAITAPYDEIKREFG